jgi:hypothetical protein
MNNTAQILCPFNKIKKNKKNKKSRRKKINKNIMLEEKRLYSNLN